MTDAAELVKLADFADTLRKYWTFDDGQQHTHSWHDRENFIEKVLPRLLAAQQDGADREATGRKVMQTSQACSEGYKRGITSFSTEAEKDANEKCAIAASNTGWFILQSLGFETEEIRALADKYRAVVEQGEP